MLSIGEILGIIGAVVAVVEGIVIFAKRETLFKVKTEGSIEDVEDALKDIKELQKTTHQLSSDMAGALKSIAQIILDNQKQEDQIRLTDKAMLLLSHKTDSNEKLFERVAMQQADFQKNIMEMSHVISQLKGTMEGVKGLLERILSGEIKVNGKS